MPFDSSAYLEKQKGQNNERRKGFHFALLARLLSYSPYHTVLL